MQESLSSDVARSSARRDSRASTNHPHFKHAYQQHAHGGSYSSQASDGQYNYVSALLQQPSASTSQSTSNCSSPSLYRQSGNSVWASDALLTPVSYASDSEEEGDQIYPYDKSLPSPRRSSSPPTEPLSDDPNMPLFQSIAAMLASASLSASSSSSLERCFCGQPAEEDSIYCSVTCGRQDAMKALCCGTEESDRSEGSHYRRVESLESKRESEWEKKRSRVQKKKRKESRGGGGGGDWTSDATASSSSLKRSSSSLKVELGASSSTLTRSDSRSTSHSTVPSLSSTASSIRSYSTCDTDYDDSPSPSPSPFLTTPNNLSFPFPSFNGNGEPGSPQPTLRAGISFEDMETELYFSTNEGGLGLEYEGEDRVTSISIGWGGEELKERVKGRLPRTRGAGTRHQRGKLSFDDVVGIMGA